MTTIQKPKQCNRCNLRDLVDLAEFLSTNNYTPTSKAYKVLTENRSYKTKTGDFSKRVCDAIVKRYIASFSHTSLGELLNLNIGEGLILQPRDDRKTLTLLDGHLFFKKIIFVRNKWGMFYFYEYDVANGKLV